MWTLDGDDHTIVIDFIVGGQFVEPTSASMTLRDHTGQVIVSSVALTVEGSSAVVSIEGSNNSPLVQGEVENRYLNVYFLYGAKQHRIDLSYRVGPFIPLSATPADVRAQLGLDASELPDEDVDLGRAYLSLVQEYGTAFQDAFVDGILWAPALDAVVYQATLEILDSLQFRAGVMFSSEESRFQRMQEFDIPRMRMDLGRKLSSKLDIALNRDPEVVQSLALATPTDVITGE